MLNLNRLLDLITLQITVVVDLYNCFYIICALLISIGFYCSYYFVFDVMYFFLLTWITLKWSYFNTTCAHSYLNTINNTRFTLYTYTLFVIARNRAFRVKVKARKSTVGRRHFVIARHGAFAVSRKVRKIFWEKFYLKTISTTYKKIVKFLKINIVSSKNVFKNIIFMKNLSTQLWSIFQAIKILLKTSFRISYRFNDICLKT